MFRRLVFAIAGVGLVVAVPSSVISAPKTGAVEGAIVLKDDDGDPVADRSDVIVYLDGVPDALPDQSKVVHTVRQTNKQFGPRMLVALKGSTVAFPNDDKIDHNVFSLSRAARFDLGLYRSGESKSVKLKRTGIVDVYCNIHPDMSAKILVLDTKYHATTDGKGRFRIDKVPPGKYKLIAWQSRGEPFEGRVEITAGGTTRPTVTLVQTKKAHERHKRKDGTPYGRYE